MFVTIAEKKLEVAQTTNLEEQNAGQKTETAVDKSKKTKKKTGTKRSNYFYCLKNYYNCRVAISNISDILPPQKKFSVNFSFNKRYYLI